MCLFFLLPVLGCLVFSFIEWRCSLPRCVDSALILFVCFYRSRFCSLAINYASLNQSKGCFPFILLCRRKRYYWTGPLDWHIKYTNINWGEFMYSLKKYLNVLNIGWVWLTKRYVILTKIFLLMWRFVRIFSIIYLYYSYMNYVYERSLILSWWKPLSYRTASVTKEWNEETQYFQDRLI